MGYLQRYVGKYWRPFCVALLFLTGEAICDLTLPTLMADIVDIGVAQKRMDAILRYGGQMLLIAALGAVAAAVRNVVSSNVSQRFGAELRADLFQKIQLFTFENINRFDRASLVTRLTNDVTQVQNFANGLMRIFVKAPLLCIGSLVLAVRLNHHLALVLAVVVPVVSLLIALNMKVAFPLFLKVQKSLDNMNGVMREYLSGVRVVKAFNRFAYETEKFGIANREFQNRSVVAMRMMAVFNPLIMLAMNFGIVAVLWLGGYGVHRGTVQVGEIIAFINYMTQILFSLMMISMVFNMFVRARASAGRIGEVFGAQNAAADGKMIGTGESGEKGRVDFERVSFSYDGPKGELALRDITFSCLPGETVGIIGSTGSGKSTLVGLIPRFYDATSGVVKVDGADVRMVDPADLREKIAIVPQQTVLFSGSVADNIRWGKEDASFAEITEAARTAQAHAFIEGFAEGYDTRVGQKGVNLSGGQKQRISLARALVRKPEILILDDSTSAVDTETETQIRQGLKEYARDMTVIVIAQRITSIMDADKIIVLDDGRMVGCGKHAELLAGCGVYREIYHSQIGREVKLHG
ncbi:MAG TPA: ABC transporter ATP-binding protein [Bacilli bacterium]